MCLPTQINPALRERAVRLVREHRADNPSISKTIEAVVRQERVGAESLRRWVVQANTDGGAGDGVTISERGEIIRLKADNRLRREGVAILKTVTTFFARELDPRSRRFWASFTSSALRALQASQSCGLA